MRSGKTHQTAKMLLDHSLSNPGSSNVLLVSSDCYATFVFNYVRKLIEKEAGETVLEIQKPVIRFKNGSQIQVSTISDFQGPDP